MNTRPKAFLSISAFSMEQRTIADLTAAFLVDLDVQKAEDVLLDR